MPNQIQPQEQQGQSQQMQSQPAYEKAGMFSEDRRRVRQAVSTLSGFETDMDLARVHAEWTGRSRAARLFGDLVTITRAEKQLIARRSPFADPIGQAVLQTIQQGLQQLQMDADDPEIQQALSQAQPAIEAVRNNVMERVGPQGQWGQQGIQQQHTQSQPMYEQVGPFWDDRERVRQAVRTLNEFETDLDLTRIHAHAMGRSRAARLCADLETIIHMEKQLILRRSPFAGPIGQAVLQTIQQGLQQLQMDADDPEIQQALSQAQPALEAVRNAVATQLGQQSSRQQSQYGTGQHQGQSHMSQ